MPHTHPEPHKASWPPFALAATGFIPFIGLFTGVAAIIWGLLANRPKALWAAGLGAAAVIAQFGFSVLLLGWLDQSPAYLAAQAELTRKDLVEVVESLEEWHERHGEYPDRLEMLIGTGIPRSFINIYDHSAGLVRIPHSYQYEVAPGGRSYDLFAVGPDALPDTEDDIRPVLPDSLKARSGYRP